MATQPHITIRTLNGNVHVIPAVVFERVVSGEMLVTAIEDWEIIVRSIVAEWLEGLEEKDQ